MAKRKGDDKSKQADGNGANLGLEAKLWAAAEMRGHMDAAEYKHVALGLTFLKYTSDAFQTMHDHLKADREADAEDRDEYKATSVRRAFVLVVYGDEITRHFEARVGIEGAWHLWIVDRSTSTKYRWAFGDEAGFGAIADQRHVRDEALT